MAFFLQACTISMLSFTTVYVLQNRYYVRAYGIFLTDKYSLSHAIHGRDSRQVQTTDWSRYAQVSIQLSRRTKVLSSWWYTSVLSSLYRYYIRGVIPNPPPWIRDSNESRIHLETSKFENRAAPLLFRSFKIRAQNFLWNLKLLVSLAIQSDIKT